MARYKQFFPMKYLTRSFPPVARKLYNSISRNLRIRVLILVCLTLIASISEYYVLTLFLPLVKIFQSAAQSVNDQSIYLEYSEFLHTGILFCIAIIISGTLKIINLSFTTKVSSKITSELSSKCYTNMLNTKYSTLAKINKNQLVAVCTTQMSLSSVAISSMLNLFTSLLISITIISVLLAKEPLITLLITVILMIVYLTINLLYTTKLRSNSKKVKKMIDIQQQIVTESIYQHKEIIVNKNYQFFASLFENSDYQMRRLQAENSFISGFPKFALESIMLMTIIIVALFQVRSERYQNLPTTLGLLAIGVQKLFLLFKQFMQSFTNIKSRLSSLSEVLNYSSPRTKVANNISALSANIQENSLISKVSMSLRDISFQYDNAPVNIFSGVSFDLLEGDILCISGPSGYGKSTLIDLILGLIEPSEGYIMFNNEQLKGFNIERLHANLAYVPQSPFIQSGTVRENIIFGHNKVKEANEEKFLEQVCDLALVSDFINQFPQGLNECIGEGYRKLSGGQIQRLAIARALFQAKKFSYWMNP